jgi:hypothetical protein
MKRVGILVALITLAVLVTLPFTSPRADAATRVVRSRDKGDEKDKKILPTSGNVSRSRSVGNVRSSTSSNVNSTRTTTVPRVTRTSSSSRTTNTASTRRVTYTSGGSSSPTVRRVSSSGGTNTAGTRRVTYTSGGSSSPTVGRVSSSGGTNTAGTRRVTYTSGGSSSPTVGRVTRPSTTRPTAGHVVQPTVGTIRPFSATPTVRRVTRTVGLRTDGRSAQPGNVSIGEGNAVWRGHTTIMTTTSPRILARDLVRTRHEDEDHHCHRRRPHWWFRRHDDHHDVWYYGRWVNTDDRYYCSRLVPPWATTTRVVYVPDTVIRTQVVEPVVVVVAQQPEAPAPSLVEQPATPDYDTYLTRQQIDDPVVMAPLTLTPTEYRRAQALIARGVIGNLLKEADVHGENSYELDPAQATLTITAPAERIVIIETMVRDERTFKAVTEPNRYGHSVTVAALVSPYFLQEDFEGAVRLASANFSALRRTLEDRSPNYASYGKECWLNSEYGTVTIVDDTEAMAAVRALVALKPYIPAQFINMDEPAEAQ